MEDEFEIVLGPSRGSRLREFTPGEGVVYRQVILPDGRPDPPVSVIFHYDALCGMLEHAGSDLKMEIGGMLAGRAWSGENGPVAEVQKVLPALRGRSSGSSFTIGHEAWDDINRELADTEGNLSLVGWYHTHPGFEVFFSGQDRFSHLSFFREPFHFALVIDPIRWKTGLFVTVDGKVEMFNRFEAACPEGSAEEMDQYLRTWFRA